MAVALLLGGAVIFTALAIHRAVDRVSAPRTIPYMVVTGDTPASVGSLFAVDPAVIERETGATSPQEGLSAGQHLALDPAPLWRLLSGGARAPNAALVAGTARRMGVEPALALAVAWQESRLDQSARSVTGAVGIMQVEPETGRLASADLSTPLDITRAEDNVRAGVFWLRSLLSSYTGDRASALAAYYEGPGNLARQGYLAGTSAYVAHGLALRAALLNAGSGLGS